MWNDGDAFCLKNLLFLIVPCKIPLHEGTINNRHLIPVFLIQSIFVLEIRIILSECI